MIGASTEETRPVEAGVHLVVKRGHRGRYRFVLMRGTERIGGEVQVAGAAAEDKDALRALAMARITRLAEALLERAGP